jgi:hypothetical protein
MPQLAGGGGGGSAANLVKAPYKKVAGIGVVKTAQSGASHPVSRPATTINPPPVRQAQFNAPAPQAQSFAAAAPAGIAAPSAAPSEADYLAGDSAYQAQLAALTKALSDYQADQTNQNSQYDTQYNQGLSSLGYQAPAPGADGSADPNAVGGWNFQDQNTSAGRSYQNQLNDFASRGELQSSGYGEALDNLTRSLNTQKGSMDTSRQGFEDNLASQLSSQQNQNTLSLQQAKADAIARRAAQYALT